LHPEKIKFRNQGNLLRESGTNRGNVQELTVDGILAGIKERDTKILDLIYTEFYPQLKGFILRNQGTEEDAQDVYQDAVLVIYQKLQQANLAMNCSFNTYLYSVGRLLWLKQLERRRLLSYVANEVFEDLDLDGDLLLIDRANERYKLYQDHFNQLSYNCQKILEMFLAKIPVKDITRILGYKSDQYTKKRKHQCKEKLIKNIKNDSRFNELFNQQILQTNIKYGKLSENRRMDRWTTVG
jgi:RNA polymerase sigma factor (sigma-70 family)